MQSAHPECHLRSAVGTNHVCRLCCSRALWTARQRTQLASASEVRCSAVQSMARGGSYFPEQTHPTHTKNNQNNSKQQQTQSPTDTAPTPKQGGQAQGKRREDRRGPQSMSSTRKTQNKFSAEQGTEAPRHRKKTREQRQRDKEQPKEVRAPENRGSKNRERGQQRRAEQNTNTGTPTQRREAGSREAAADRRRRGTRGPERVHTCLSGRPKGDLEHQR